MKKKVIVLAAAPSADTQALRKAMENQSPVEVLDLTAELAQLEPQLDNLEARQLEMEQLVVDLRGCEAETDSLAAWEKIWDIELRNGYFLARGAAKRMKESGGDLVFLSTPEEYLSTSDCGPITSIAQGTIRSMVMALAECCGPEGVRVNGVCAAGAAPDVLRYPLGAALSAEDMAAAIAFLHAPESGYISGNTLRLDGGSVLMYRRYQIGK